MTVETTPTMFDAIARRQVALPDGRVGILTYCPSEARKRRRKDDDVVRRQDLATVYIGTARHHPEPSTLQLLDPNPGDMVKVYPADGIEGRPIEAIFVGGDSKSITVQKPTAPSFQVTRIPRSVVGRVAVVADRKKR